jgi:hypothetical protein
MRITADAVATCLAFVFVLVLADVWLVAQQSGSATEASASADDCWRRTAHGWELARWAPQPIDPLRARFLVRDTSETTQPRLDFHPAWLAAGQLAAVAAVILMQQTNQERQEREK